MPRSLRAYLWDIEQAVSDIQSFTRDKQLSDYETDTMLRAAVERNFQIIGEALSQAQRFFPQVTGRITNQQQISLPQPSDSRLRDGQARSGSGHCADQLARLARGGSTTAAGVQRRLRAC